MLRTFAISAVAAALFAAVWTVDLVRYHPADDGLNPLAPISLSLASKQ